MEEGRRWAWVRIPRPLYIEIKMRAEKEDIAVWKVLQRAWSYWRATQLRHHVGHSEVDKAAWYAFKFSSSVGELKAAPSQSKLELLRKTCEQIRARLNIDTSHIMYAAEQYVRQPSEKNKVALNDAAKAVVAQILLAFSTHAQAEQPAGVNHGETQC